MKRNLAKEHPDDVALLGYLDAELSRVAMRRTEGHLQSCWKCRSALAELETQAQNISRLLSDQDDSDIARMQHAKAKFLNLKRSLETLRDEPPRKTSSTFFKCETAGTAVCNHTSRLLFVWQRQESRLVHVQLRQTLALEGDLVLNPVLVQAASQTDHALFGWFLAGSKPVARRPVALSSVGAKPPFHASGRTGTAACP
jgi:hypothetical protein